MLHCPTHSTWNATASVVLGVSPVGKGEGDPGTGTGEPEEVEGEPEEGDGEPEEVEGEREEGEGEPEEVEGEGLVLPLGDGGVFVAGGGGGGEGVELATHEPNPLQTCPDWQICMCRPSLRLLPLMSPSHNYRSDDGLLHHAVANPPSCDGSPACTGKPALRNKAGHFVD